MLLIQDLAAVFLEGIAFEAATLEKHIKASIALMDNFFRKKEPFSDDCYNYSEKTFIALLSAHRVTKNALLSVGGALGSEEAGLKRVKADVVETEFFDSADSKTAQKLEAKMATIKSELTIAANRINLIVDFNAADDLVVKNWFQSPPTSNLYLT